MSEEVTLLLVGEESSGKMDIISTFIINSKRFSNRTLNNSFASAEIIIQNRNIKLNIHDVDSNFTNFENLKPSAILFIYDITEEKSFEALDTWLEKMKKAFDSIFPNIKKVLVENNSDEFKDEKVTIEQIKDFAEKTGHNFYIVYTNKISSLDNLFIGVIKNVLGIIEEDNIINYKQNYNSKPDNIINISMVLIGEKEEENKDIINAFVNKHNPSNKKTEGNYASVTIQVQNKNVILNLHELSSDPESLNNSKLTPSAVLFVYNINRKESFEAIKDKWYSAVNNLWPNAIKVLVGNDPEEVKEGKIKEEDANNFAESIKASFYLVIPKKNYNIEELFMDTAKNIIESKEKGCCSCFK